MADWRSKLARGLFPTKNRLIGALKKNYCQQHLSRKGRAPFVVPAPNQGFSRLAIVKALAAAAGVLSVTFYELNVETVPYSKRMRLVLPTSFERKYREVDLNNIKEQNKGKVLPDDHPLSVRVRSIKNRLVEALERDLRGDKVWPVWERFRKRNKMPYFVRIHEWETVVIDDPDRIGASFTLGGIIVVYTGALKILESDAELAFYIAHEIGHGVGCHLVERLVRIISLDRGRGLSTDFISARKETEKHPSYLSLSRKLECEADYIGLLLMASAGYDPSIGLKLWEKRATMGLESGLTHPSYERRVELAAQTQEEAMSFYKNSKIHYIKDN